MLSQSVEYALRAVVYLAAQHPAPLTTQKIAQRTRVPQAYLSKILQNLVRADLVHSQRGLRGGMTLARSPDHLTILDIVNAVEPIARIRSCPLGLTAHGVRLCPLHRRLDNALALVEKAFADTTLRDVLTEPSRSAPLCDIPKPARKRA
jgi:Rrf2 family protein